MKNKNGLAALAYLLGLITGIIVFLISEPRDRFLKFHAVQSILFHIAIIVIGIVLSAAMLPFAMVSGGMGYPAYPGMLGLGAVWVLYGIVVFIIWIVLMIRAYSGQKYKLPVLGDFAEEWTK